MKRLEFAGVRICQRCGRGHADLVATDGTTFAVPIDAARGTELGARGSAGEIRWLSAVLLDQLAASGAAVREVVLDTGEHGLRGLISIARGGEYEVVACTPQECIGLVARGDFPLYATDEALAAVVGDTGTDETVH